MGEPQGLGREFSALLGATFVTNLGDGLRFAALPLLATTLTSSPLLISGVTAAQFLPWTTFAPIGGVIVDRSDRRRLIVVTQVWRAAAMAALTVVVATGNAAIWHLFVVAYLLTVGEILVDPSVVATLPTIVDKERLDEANGRLTTVEVVTNDFVGGPVGAAAFFAAPWLPFLIDAFSYLGSTAPFSRLPAGRARSTDRSVDGVAKRSVRAEIGEGLQWIRGHAFLRPATLAIAIFHLGTGGALGLLVELVDDVLDAPAMFGFVLASAAVGATFASLVAARLTERFSRQYVVTAAATVAAASLLGAAASASVWQLMVIWLVNGAAGGILLAIGRGFVQRHTPGDRLGRTAIAQRTITRSSFVIGAVLAGTTATVGSVRASFVVAGLFHLAGAALLWRAFLTEPEPTPDESATTD